jgi:hypothetical protein
MRRTKGDIQAIEAMQMLRLDDGLRRPACNADHLPIELRKPSDRGVPQRDREDAVANPLSFSCSTPL